MIVSVCAYLDHYFFRASQHLFHAFGQKSQLLTHHKDRAILTLMSLDSVIEKYDEYLYPDMDLSELVKTISASRRDVFPVVDRQHRLVGIIYLDDVRPIMFRQELYHRFQIGQLMKEPVARLNIDDSMDVVLLTFDKTQAWTLPVVDTKVRSWASSASRTC